MKKKLLMVLKMTALYSFTGLLCQIILFNMLLASPPSNAQNLKDVKINMPASKITIERAFQIIEQKTNFKFNYIKDEIPLQEGVEVDFDTESLYDILVAFAKEYGLVFNRINDQITVKKAQTPLVEIEQTILIENGTVKGKVVDASTKAAMPGATIQLQGTTYGTYSDKKGEFVLLNVKPGNYKISISFVSYQSEIKQITVEPGKITDVISELSEGTINLDETVVTGTISERSVRAVANPITVITSKEIESRNLTTLTSVLESVPGIELAGGAESVNNLTSGTPYTSIYMRGGAPLSNIISEAGIKYFIDGVEVSDGSLLNRLNPNDIEKMEVSRGPMSSTLYGAGSSSGVIQIFTKKGWMNNLRVSLRSMFTSQENKYQDSNPLNQNYNLNVTGGSVDYGYSFGMDYTKTPISRFASNNGIDYENYGFNAGARARLSTLSIDLKVNYSTMTNGTYINRWLYNYAVENNWPLPLKYYYSLSDTKTVNEGINVSLNLKQLLASNWYHNLLIGYAKNGLSSDTYSNSGTTSSPYYMSYYRDFRKYNLRYFMNLNQSIFEGFNADITAGAEYVGYKFVDWGSMFTTSQQDYMSQSYYSSYGGYRSIYPTKTIGLFGEAVWGYKNVLFLTTGLRAEKNSGYGDDLGWYTMPRLGLSYIQEFGDFKLKPRFSIGKSSSPASPYYKMALTSSYSNQLANPELKPQQQSGWETGVDIYFSNWISLNFTYYKQKMEDLIVAVYYQRTTYPYTFQYQNVANADNEGVELSAKILVNPFTLDISYTYVSSKYGAGYTSTTTNVRTGWRIPDIPNGSFFARLSYHIPAFFSWSDKGGNVSFEYRRNGNVFSFDLVNYYKDLNYYNAGTGSYPSYYTYYKEFKGYDKFNLRADYSFTNDLSVFTDISNLFNNQDIVGGAAPMIGRTISFGFNFSY